MALCYSARGALILYKLISIWTVKTILVLSWDTVSYKVHCYFGTIMHYEDTALSIVIGALRPQPKTGKFEHNYDLQPNPIRGGKKEKPSFYR